MTTFTLTRVSEKIYSVVASVPFCDGQISSARVAFSNGILCSMRAQSLDREAGMHYLLMIPVCFKGEFVQAANRLAIGESAEIKR